MFWGGGFRIAHTRNVIMFQERAYSNKTLDEELVKLAAEMVKVFRLLSLIIPCFKFLMVLSKENLIGCMLTMKLKIYFHLDLLFTFEVFGN